MVTRHLQAGERPAVLSDLDAPRCWTPSGPRPGRAAGGGRASTSSRPSPAVARVGPWWTSRSQPTPPSGRRQWTVAGWYWPRAWRPAVAGLGPDHAVVVEPAGGDPPRLVLHDLLDGVRPGEPLEGGPGGGGHAHADVLQQRRHAEVVAVGERLGGRGPGAGAGQVGAPQRQAEAADVGVQVHAVGAAVGAAEVAEARRATSGRRRSTAPPRSRRPSAGRSARASGRCQRPRARRSMP